MSHFFDSDFRGDEIEDSLQAEQDFLLTKQNFVQIREVKPVFQEYYIFESQWKTEIYHCPWDVNRLVKAALSSHGNNRQVRKKNDVQKTISIRKHYAL